MLRFKAKSFQQLSSKELYRILQFRTAVFVVEQDCIYQDIDGKDTEALHIIGFDKEDSIIAYARVFKAGLYFEQASIGRVVVAKSVRGLGYGHRLVDFAIETISINFTTKNILISAQCHLIAFYNKHGFKTIGAMYLEDGIEHIKMQRY